MIAADWMGHPWHPKRPHQPYHELAGCNLDHEIGVYWRLLRRYRVQVCRDPIYVSQVSAILHTLLEIRRRAIREAGR